MLKISVLSPSVRPGGLDVVAKCLKRQSYPKENIEWLVSTNYDPPTPAVQVGMADKGDYYYSLNRDWNRLYQKVTGDLIVNIVDLLWFPPDILEKFANHYSNNPKALVGAIGHQYEREENGRYEGLCWQDPRARTDQGSFYEIYPTDMEMCLCSIPIQAIYDVGGLDEEFDKYAAMSEKEMCVRMDKLGYKFYLDQTIEYRALHHPRLNDEWDKHYFAGADYWKQCLADVESRKRLKLGFVNPPDTSL